MADALAHVVTARIAGTGVRDPDARFLLLVGVVMPDLLEKFPVVVLGSPPLFALPSHAIAGIVLWAYLFSLCFEESLRRTAFSSLFAGGLLHVVLDIFKDNVGPPSEFILFPFWDGGMELGGYWTEDAVYALPANLLLLLAFRLTERRRRR